MPSQSNCIMHGPDETQITASIEPKHSAVVAPEQAQQHRYKHDAQVLLIVLENLQLVWEGVAF